MTNNNDVETGWQNHVRAAEGYYSIGMLDESEREIAKISPDAVANSVPILTLCLQICYCREDWAKMKAFARQLYLLDPSDPRHPFADGFATAKIESITSNKD